MALVGAVIVVNIFSSSTVDDFIAPPCAEQIELLYQDDQLLVINKPSGLLSLSGKNPLNQDSVHYRLVQDFPTALMAHRLDFGTSGVMVLALNKSVNAHLTKQFQNRTVKKTYTAILAGHLVDTKGCIEAPIAKSAFPRQKICHSTGKPALSAYQVLERLDKPARTRVLFNPETGRTHQLRIHSQAIGHPILGCDLYGTEQTRTMAVRLLLHASTIEFEHPEIGERVYFKSSCPF